MNATTIRTLSPIDVKSSYIDPTLPYHDQFTAGFNIFKIQELLPFVRLPHPPFKLTTHAIVLITKGEIEMWLYDKAYCFGAGEIILVPAGQINGFNYISTTSEGFMSTFTDNFFLPATETLGASVYDEMLSPEQLPHLRPEPPLFQLLTQLFARLRALRTTSSGWQDNELRQQHLRSILTELRLLHAANSVSKNSRADQLVIRFKKLIMTTNRLRPTPHYFATQLNVTTNHLNKILKQKTQLTTSQWIANHQIAEAKLQLSRTHQPISEIAYTLGFAEPTYFSKFFIQQTGESPTAFRKRID